MYGNFESDQEFVPVFDDATYAVIPASAKIFLKGKFIQQEQPATTQALTDAKDQEHSQEQPKQKSVSLSSRYSDFRRHRLIEMPGSGRKKFPLPTLDQIRQAASLKIAEIKITQAALEKQSSRTKRTARRQGSILDRFRSTHLRQLFGQDANYIPRLSDAISVIGWLKNWFSSIHDTNKSNSDSVTSATNTAHIPTAGEPTADANAMRILAEKLRLTFDDERWSAIIARLFNYQRGAVKWAAENKEQYKEGAESLQEHYEGIRALYRQTLPEIYDMVRLHFPELDESEWEAAAVHIISEHEDLAQILYVLDHYADAFAQIRDGFYTPLDVVIATTEEASNLFFTGEVTTTKAKAKEAIVGNINHLAGEFLAHAGSEGPATFPGAAGPVGLNLILVPEDEVGIIMLMLVLYLHEFRHDVFAAIDGLAEEEALALAVAIQQAIDDGTVKLSEETVMLGEEPIPLAKLLVSIFLQNLSEIDPDLAGGVGICGFAYDLILLSLLNAFNSKRHGGTIRCKQLLRTNSYYQVNKKGELRFEAHPIDYFRLYLNAAYLDIKGFKHEADQIRYLANAAINFAKPEFLTWEDIDDKLPPIQIRFDDMLQLATVAAKAIMKTPFEALHGKSNSEIVNWSPKHQAKAQMLVDNLLADDSTVPKDKGSFHLTMVASATAIALFQAQSRGEADLHKINKNALAMAFEVMARNASQS